MRRNTVCWIGLTLALTLSLALGAAASARAGSEGPVRSGATALTENAVYVIEAESRSPQGHLRVGIDRSAVGAPAVLQRPVTDLALRTQRHRQYWRVVRWNGDYYFQLRNLYSDMCLTVARPEHSPVYLQYCGASVKGQYWGWSHPGIIFSRNQGTDVSPSGVFGGPRTMCLDITEFRNVPGTRLQVGKCHEKWNQLWKFKRVNEQYVR